MSKNWLLVVASLLVLAAAQDDPIVEAPVGFIKGTLKSYSVGSSDKYYSFKGIPYAVPPVGDLRFRAPVPFPDWGNDTLNATEHRNTCVQAGTLPIYNVGAEDCLYLNVYTPSLNGTRNVMFWVHGGSYTGGSGNSRIYGPEHLIKEDIVLVTINYRLGVLGFLATGDSASPGNYGMKDMVEALRWVRRNIAAFSGDPNKVTIFGESAGGASIHFLVLSSMTKGLFHQAISESGTALMPWALQPNPLKIAQKAASLLNITWTTSEEVVEQFRKIDPFDFLSIVPGSIALEIPRGLSPFDFAPVVEPPYSPEEKFLTAPPLEIIRSETFNKVPYICGQNSDEALIFDREPLISPGVFDILNANMSLLIPYNWRVKPDTPEAEEIIRSIRDRYFNGSDIKEMYDYIRFMTDNIFTYGVYKTVQMHSVRQTAPVFHYVFSFSGAFNYPKTVLGLSSKYPGAMHADEVPYIFKTYLPEIVRPGNPALMVRKRLVTMWTSFAKYGHPTYQMDDSVLDTIWPRVGPVVEYIDINTEITAKVWPFENRLKEWRELYAKYGP